MRDIGIYNLNFLNSDDARFVNTRKVLDAKMKSLVAHGVGTDAKQADPILPFHELKLWEECVFGNYNAESLQYTVFFYCCKIFGLRGVDEHRALQCQKFKIGSDERGKFIQFIGRQSKTCKGGILHMDLSNKNIKHYCIKGRILFPYFYQTEVSLNARLLKNKQKY